MDGVTAFREALEESTRQRTPLQWATTLDGLATAYVALGKNIEHDTKWFNEAVEIYGEALSVFTRELMPLQWATTTDHLAVALLALGERTSETEYSGASENIN